MILAVTGHRPSKLAGGYSDATFAKLVRFAISELDAIKPEKVLTGMALGWDLAIAEACIQLKLHYVACHPCDNQDSKWPEKSRKLWRMLSRLADERITVSPGPYTSRCMQVRNIYMADNCDTLLALWNGTDGGTANCVRYAESKGKPIVNCWERWENFE